MMKKKYGNIYILYCFFIANFVFSESQLKEISIINDILTITRYALANLFAVVMLQKSGLSFSKKHFFGIGIFAIAVIINIVLCSGGAGLLLLGVVVASLYYSNVEVERLVSLTIKTSWVCCAIVILLCLCGILEDRAMIRYVGANFISFYDGSSPRHTFGFLVANQIPFLLFFTYIYLIMTKREKFKTYQHLIFLFLNVIALMLFGSRVTFGMILFVMCAYFIAKMVSKKWQKKGKERKINLLWLSFPICFMISILASIMYNPIVYSWLRLNNILMNRLLFSNTAINKFGVTLFGSGKDVFESFTVDGFSSVALDNGYVDLLLQRGIIITAIVIFAWTWLTFRAGKVGNFYLVFCLSALAFHNLIDSHLTSYKVIPIFVLMFDQYSQVLAMYRDRTKK